VARLTKDEDESIRCWKKEMIFKTVFYFMGIMISQS